MPGSLQGPGFAPTATGYCLCPGQEPRQEKLSILPLLHSEASEEVPDRAPLGKCPGAPAFTSWRVFPPQKYNADYDLSARQGADTLAFMSLLEEKLLPVLVSVPRPPSVHGQRGRGRGTAPSPPGLEQHGDQKPTGVGQVHWLRPASAFVFARCRYILSG